MIEVSQLSKHYGSTRAVDDLSFRIQPGRVTGFLGPNGAGKSTTMRMIVGLDVPTSGIARIAGRPFASIRRPLFEVGTVLETRATHGGRRAVDHLLCLAQSNGIGRRRVHEVLELVGLESVARRRTKGFSLGMAQRLGLAAALLGDPPVILCDEPVNGLDPEGILWIRTLLRSLAAEGRTVFVSSHLMSEMELTADHLIVIGQGRLIADASVAEIIRRGSRAEVSVASPSAAQLAAILTGAGADIERAPESDRLQVHGLTPAEIGDLAAHHSIALHELTPVEASLESAFMSLTRDSVDFHAEVA
ncbi:MAG: type transport system ATP-binding protein [Pseudonocardiales bacterium]|nr:type transport system ATP-binding protein [Pseudonocardiales bacterium]